MSVRDQYEYNGDLSESGSNYCHYITVVCGERRPEHAELAKPRPPVTDLFT
jgi:hypothetical protein